MNFLLTSLLVLTACSKPSQVPVTYDSGVSAALQRTYKIVVDCPGTGNDSSGSAVNIGDNLVVTAKHVVTPWEDACKLTLKHGDTSHVAFLLHLYGSWDLAVLLAPDAPMAHLPFEAPALGMPVMALGYSAGVLGVTFGHIAGLPDEDGDVRFTAPIYFGNSGGGVWTLDGKRLIGISVNGYFNRPLWFNLVPAEKIRDSFLVP